MIAPTLALILVAAPVADDATSEHLDQARKAAWTLADIIVDVLVPVDHPEEFPALKTFADEVRLARKAAHPDGPDGKTKPIDANKLVTRNPHFWRANYEVGPGDPAWLALHGSLLLAGDEASRAQAILALDRLDRSMPEAMKQGINVLLSQADRIIADGNNAVQAGVEKFDNGDRAGAMKEYRAALAAWPQNSWAEYEVGLTLMTEPMVKDPKAEPIQTPEVMAAFERSRHSNPFQWKAYQGKFEEARPQLLALAKKVMPAWEKIQRTDGSLTDGELKAFSEGCQEAGIDELALVSRQIFVIHRGSFRTEDHPFITLSLRRLVPGPETEDVLKRLAGKSLKLRRLMEPEKPAEAKP